MDGLSDDIWKKKARQITKAWEKKSRNGDNEAALVKIYPNKTTRKAIEEIEPDELSPLDLDTVLEGIYDFIDEWYEDYPLFVIKIKRDSKDGGEQILIKGGKTRSQSRSNNNDFSLGKSAGALGIIMQMMEKNNQSGVAMMQLKSNYDKKEQKRRRKEDKAFFKSKINKLKKKKKGKKTGFAKKAEKLVKSPIVQELGKGLIKNILGQPVPQNVVKFQQPIEYANVASPTPTTPKTKAQKEKVATNPTANMKPNEPIENEDDYNEEIYEPSEDDLIAVEAVKLLENNGFENPGQFIFICCHYLSENKGMLDMIKPQLDAHKEKALADLIY